jgi:hypothetical protein
MYDVQDAMSTLQQQQLVHAVVLADMLGVEGTTQQAVEALTSAAQSEQGLSAAALEALASLAAWPACLLQLLPAILKNTPCCSIDTSQVEDIAAADTKGRMQQLLLAVFGDLDAACGDRQLKALLLGMPLPAMQLLLSSDQLRVASEDTVLYVAQRFLSIYDHSVDEEQPDYLAKLKLMEKVQKALAPLVRVPHLSLFALSCAALGGGSLSDYVQPLEVYMAQVRGLLSMRQVAAEEQVAASLDRLGDTPASWRLGPCQIRPLADGVRLGWRLPVEQLRQACRDSFEQQKGLDIFSPESSAPMGGLSWLLMVSCWQEGGGTVVGFFAGPRMLCPHMWYKYKFTITWNGFSFPSRDGVLTNRFWGFANCFRLASMAAGGWDDAVWASTGLPTSGEMLLQLQLHSVG